MGAQVWTMPWIRPTRPPALAALTELPRPLAAWRTGEEFDVDDYYSQFSAKEMTPVERAVRKAGDRPEWRFEEIWLPDDESELEEYDKDCRLVEGYRINPRCLAEYRVMVERIVGDEFDDPEESLPDDDLAEALAWAEAGVCVLQQSLPYPFMDCLPYAILGNRAVLECWFLYASLLSRRHPRKASPWFRGLVFANPTDNLGARYYSAGAAYSE
ncbi:hypothetical protein AB0876_32285 [Mycobacterium sp. NPDC049093]